ncbi:MAG: M1 family aminopeptidase [Pseudomonadales bacterium]
MFEVFRFEINYHRRQYLFYVLSGVFFLLAFLATTTPNVQMVGGVDNVNINSPYTVLLTLTSLSTICVFGAIAFCASGVIRDYDMNVAELFLSSPVTKSDYLYGRFLGSLVFAFGLFLAGSLGVFLGELMPWLDSERIGPIPFGAYWYSIWAIGLPNMFACACIFFCVATVTRSMMATYVGMIVLLMLTFLLGTFTEKETVELTSILDPFGGTALGEVTRYWTVFEKNSMVPALEGALLANRVLWIVIGLGFLALAYPLFRFNVDSGKKPKKQEVQEQRVSVETTLLAVTVHQDFSGRAQWMQYLSQTRIEVLNIVKSVPFVILLIVGLVSVTANAAANLGNIFGTAVYPTTAIMVNIINGAFSLSLVAVLIYYSGELMVRERNVRVSEILDAMPHPNWVMMAAKVTGLVVVIVSMLLAAMVAGIGVQLYKGYYDINVGQYLVGLLFFFQFPLYLMIVVSVFFYILTRNKYAAMALMVLYFIYSLAAPQMGLEHYLYRFRQLFPPYSDFTGYAHNLVPYLWQTVYWGFFGCLLLVVIHLMWPRGTEDDWGNRLKVMRQRMTQPVVISIWAFSTLFVLSGGYIFYNTTILNEYTTRNERESLQAEYEKNYKQYENLPQPEPADIYAEVDIFPNKREAVLKATMVYRNLHDVPLEVVHFSVSPRVDVERLEVEGATLETYDEDYAYRIYRFDEPLAPGAEMVVDAEIAWRTPGFANNGHTVKLTPNGTFFNTQDMFPLHGYQNDQELQDNNIRRKYGLPDLERMAKIDDEEQWMTSGFNMKRRVNFETIVSTSADQIAIAPGYLQEEWTEGDRRYFHYKMDAPIWPFLSFVSADYEVKKDTWRDQVAIEVYYIHDYNVDTMVRATKDSLEYFTENFSPYQYRQFRIMEFPRYQGTFAQSFPNTIPFSEAIGFVADLRDPEEIDYVYYVTAHELAHQWWAHQVMGANVQGQTMIVESLAQYSALMVMEKEYGRDYMKRFLEFELDRYLQGRGGELIDEMPLYLVENQPYIHYRKGSVVLYAIKDYIGEENMNRALADFIEAYGMKGPPFPTTKHLIAHIRDHTPDEYEDMITDMLEKIVLYDLRVADSSVTETDDGRYEVTIDVIAHKFEADGSGAETEVPIATYLDIGVLGEEQGDAKVPEIIYLEKHEIKRNEQTIKVVVDKKPVSVGIDPLNKMIDRDPSDNVSNVAAG